MDFKHTKISLRRPLWDYAKIQWVYSHLIRRRRLQLAKRRVRSIRYLNVGCGPNVRPEFINLDRMWRPGVDLCWDIRKGIPLRERSIQGIFTEHCLEHLDYEECKFVLREFLRILMPGGCVRIVVPDAELYLDLYQRARNGEVVRFPHSDLNETTPMVSVNRVFRSFGHRFAYDAETLKHMLSEVGFVQACRASYMKGRDPQLLIDSESRMVESLYVEALREPPQLAPNGG